VFVSERSYVHLNVAHARTVIVCWCWWWRKQGKYQFTPLIFTVSLEDNVLALLIDWVRLQCTLFHCPNKQSDSDLTPTWLLKVCAPVLIPTITNIVNLSLTSGHFHHILKESVISPLLKKPTLDKDQLSNYRANLQPVSHIKNNWTCCKISTYWSPCLQWSSQSSPVCLLQASLNWNSSAVYPWSSHQCHWITEVVMSLPPWFFCRFWHRRP